MAPSVTELAVDTRAAAEPSPLIARLGAGLSLACAIHCALMPLLVGVLPLLGMSFLAEDHTEEWMVGAVVILALGSGLWGFRHHRALRVLMAFAGAVGLFLMGHWLGHDHPVGLPLTFAGGVAIAGAHWLSTRLCRTCPSDAEEEAHAHCEH
jgi:hypothetical protein